MWLCKINIYFNKVKIKKFKTSEYNLSSYKIKDVIRNKKKIRNKHINN